MKKRYTEKQIMGFPREAVLDDCSKDGADRRGHSIPAPYVTRLLDQVNAERGLLGVIRTDNGPELAGRTMQTWAARNGVELRFINLASRCRTPTTQRLGLRATALFAAQCRTAANKEKPSTASPTMPTPGL